MDQKPGRRDFLKIGCGAALSATLACSGLGVLATQAPEIQYIEKRFEGASPMKKVLVTYATRAGSTGEIADAIGQALFSAGANVDVRPVRSVTDVNRYGAVVLGSAIRFGAWLPEAVEFVNNYQASLRQVPTCFFTVHILSLDNSEASRKKRQAYTDSVRKILTPISEVFFAGKLDPAQLSFFEGLMAKAVSSPQGDFRDWKTIGAWAQGLYAALTAAGQANKPSSL